MSHRFALTSASAEVENTTTETIPTVSSDAVTARLQTHLAKGATFRCSGAVKVIDNNSTDTLTVKVYMNTSESATSAKQLWSSGAIDVADNDIINWDGHVTVRAHSSTAGAVAYSFIGANATASDGTISTAGAHTSIDTTATWYVFCTLTWSVAHADNEAQLETFVVDLFPTVSLPSSDW